MLHSSFVLGYHGCEKSVAQNALLNRCPLSPSKNKFDWLGAGIYFWENDPFRALEFAKTVKQCIEPCVIGAIIDLGYCLDLSTQDGLNQIKLVWENIVKPIYEKGEIKTNKAGKKGENGELMLRFLDCYVIEALHEFNKDNNILPFDSVKAPFWEGNELYPTAGFFSKSHIQICVRNTDNIKGYFLPKELGISF